ncbi:MAG TPA: 8-oxo-dGTP diphosphatase MutT [Gammaproteobacteria bacterium]|nr:8-oxo-dGTP diphosphatase MutT [Gammaproteobacteria bacterium]
MAKRISHWIQVATALIIKDQSVLVSKRLPPCPFQGYWEFPGGKQEVGETLQQTLKRELLEEVGIIVQEAPIVFTIRHSYQHANVQLNLFTINRYEGTPSGIEGQKIQWQGIHELEKLKLLPANKIIIDYLNQLTTGS